MDSGLPDGREAALVAEQKRWISQAASAPNLFCAKHLVIPLTLELLKGVEAGEALDLGSVPDFGPEFTVQPWRTYSYALVQMGLAQKVKGVLSLTEEGRAFLADPQPEVLATLIATRVRLFGEALGILAEAPATIEEVHQRLVVPYMLDWKTDTNTRVRITWLEVLGLVEWLGDRKLSATASGRETLSRCSLVSPEALSVNQVREAAELPPTPSEIKDLLDDLTSNSEAQEARSNYNIWVPSPPTSPNKIENLRIIMDALIQPIEKSELANFIAERFSLKLSSVESMFPFLRAAGLIREIQRGVFARTPASTAWLESGSDIDFIRILHANMRFVGELIRVVEVSTPRNEIYREGEKYGMNKEKVRWLLSLVLDAGLVFETTWSAVQATSTGLLLMQSLPLAEIGSSPEGGAALLEEAPKSDTAIEQSEVQNLVGALLRSSTDPSAENMASGAAFETSIEKCFRYMGFRAKRISGSGDTDVLVEWTDSRGHLHTAIVDGKSTSSGRVAHNNVSELAIDTHKEKNSAEFVAIVAPAFGGDTIINMARKRNWVLITASELAEIVEAQTVASLKTEEVALMFEPPEGMSRLTELIDARQRELEIITSVISRLRSEQGSGEAFSSRDVSLIERSSELTPSTDEVLTAIEFLEDVCQGAIIPVEVAQDPRFSTFKLGDPSGAARRLRAMATAIEKGTIASPSLFLSTVIKDI